ncbi:MAG: STAS domain-containing protein [Balneolaceae bacterium]
MSNEREFYIQQNVPNSTQFEMKNFNINHRRVEHVDVLDLKGELDAHTASKLEDSLKNLIEKNNHNIIVNCRDLDYIASAGLGVFMAYIEDVRGLGGDIKLTNMNERVYNVFDLLGFPTLYDIIEDENEALERFSNADN